MDYDIESAELVHQPCEDCGSSDALAVYSDHTYCFSCGTYKKREGFEKKKKEKVVKDVEGLVPDAGSFSDIPDRKITEETCRRYGVRVLADSKGIKKHIYPYYNSKGELVAQKVRVCADKNFYVKGDLSRALLFGQNLFPSGSNKSITICEGEIDCLSLSQVFGNKYPVVSVKDGCSSKKAIKDNYEYLTSFETIVLCFDGDEAGQKSIEKIAQMLPPKKLKIMRMPQDCKDPNEFLKAGKTEALKRLWYNAEEYRPKDIVNIGDMFDRVLEYRKSHEYIPTPYQGLNEMIEGTRAGQLVVLAAGSGQGKSQVLKAWMLHLLHTTEIPIGALYLEENPEDTVISLMSMEIGKPLKRNAVWDATSEKELKEAFESCSASRRIELFEPLENTQSDYVVEKIRYMIQARECKIVFFDHLTYVVDDSDDVRRDINKLVKMLHDMCVSLGVTIITCCHLRKSQSSSTHEEGARVTLDDLKDSSSIKQLADIVIGLERNSQDPDEIKANTTYVRVLKNRVFGTKGIASALLYDKDTTRLMEVPVEEDVMG